MVRNCDLEPHRTDLGLADLFRGLCYAMVIMTLRKAVREHYNIPGSDGEDFCIGWCCIPVREGNKGW